MKILHTGDWHVGRMLNRVSRVEETKAALAEVAEIANGEDVDAILVCGDVFEHQSPSAEAEQTVYEALLRLGEHGRPVVVLAGNHDHPGRWKALAPLFETSDIHVVDDLRRAEDGGIIEIPSRDGKTAAQIVVVPWVSERRLYEAAALMAGAEETHKRYADGMARAIQQLCEGFTPGKCHLLAGHIFVSGAVPSGTERQLVIGDIYAVNPSAIPATIQYAALGHVHRPQQITAAGGPTWYAGSLLRIDFGETNQDKCVNIVEVEPNRPAKVRQIMLQSPKVLRDIRCRMDELEAYAQSGDDCYYRVTLVCDGPQIGLSDQVRQILKNALIVSLADPEKTSVEAVDVRSKPPREQFEGYLAGRSDVPPDVRLLDLFDALMSEVSEDSTQGRLWNSEGEVSMSAEAPVASSVEVTPAVAQTAFTDEVCGLVPISQPGQLPFEVPAP